MVGADGVEIGDRPQHREAPDRAPGHGRVVVDEPDHVDVAADLGVDQFVGEGRAGRARPHDEGGETAGLLGLLALDGEQPGLEAEPAAAEQHQQDGERRRGEQRVAGVADRAGHGDPRGGGDRADDDAADDPDGLVDRRVAPHRSVQAGEAVADHLDHDGDGQDPDQRGAADLVARLERGERGEGPRDGGDAEVEQAQAEAVGAAGDPIDLPRQT